MSGRDFMDEKANEVNLRDKLQISMNENELLNIISTSMMLIRVS